MTSACTKNPVGAMRHRVAIQENIQTPDSQGGFTESWGTIAAVWASIEPVKAYERFQAAQLETPISHKIMLRYRTGVTTAHRILYGTRVFNIKGVINVDEAGAFLRIEAIEKQ